MLTSALYLDAKWATPFDAEPRPQPAPFTPTGGKPVTVKFMNGDAFRYATGGGWQAVSLPYQGGKLTMTALLPPAGSASCALPSQASLAAITGSLDGPRCGAGLADVSLPKVNLDTSGGVGDMKPALEQLGMGAGFNQQDADFTGLSPQACCIGFVQQAATLQVGEKGTVGAAAAAVGIVAVRRHGTRADRHRHLQPPVPAAHHRQGHRRAALPGRGRQPHRELTTPRRLRSVR